ncbi:MAG: hypothetical protein HZA24_06140 [Nitrospirae bacterium]|nr:hypothetical protein [Nitrospirota bacterium]
MVRCGWMGRLALCAAFGLLSACSGGGSSGGGQTSDTTPPDAPTALAAADVPGDQGGAIALSWTPSASVDVVAQHLYRGTTAGVYGAAPVAIIDNNSTGSFTDPAAINGAPYHYVVRAFDGVNESADSAAASAAAHDNMAPFRPTGLTAQDSAADQGGRVTLTWTPSSSADVTAQRIYRGTALGSYGAVPVAEIPGNAAGTYTDGGLTGGVTYYYVVRAFDGENQSPASGAATAAPLDNVPPAAPTALAAADTPGDNGTAIDLSWTPSASADVTAQRVYRGTQSGVYGATPVATLGVADAGFTDTGLAVGVTYHYVVRAFDGTSVSGPSIEAAATTADNTPPAAPTGLAAVDTPADGGGSIDLTWTPSASADAVGQRIYRGTQAGVYGVNPIATIANNAAGTYTDTGPVTGQTYFYVVRAFDGTRESANSGTASAQPLDNLGIGAWGLNRDMASAVSATGTRAGADGGGNRHLLWEAFDGTESDVFAARYDAASGTWDGATPLSVGAGDAGLAQLTVSAPGRALAAWVQADPAGTGPDRVLAAGFDPSTATWGAPVTLSTGPGNAASVRVALAPGGNGVAVWRALNGNTFAVFAAHLDGPSGTWSAPLRIDHMAQDAATPRVAADGQGNLVAQWSQGGILYTARYDAATATWAPADQLSGLAAGTASDHRHGFDQAGNLTAIWVQGNADLSLYAARMDVTGAWTAPAPIEALPGTPSFPELGVDAAGNALLLFTQPGAMGEDVYALRHDAATATWEAPLRLDAGAAFPGRPALSVAPDGTAFGLWHRGTGNTGRIAATRYDAATNLWSATQAVLDTGNVEGPAVAIAPDGHAIAAWTRQDPNTTSVTVKASLFQ